MLSRPVQRWLEILPGRYRYRCSSTSIKGKVPLRGWAQVTVTTSRAFYYATLTGYAYEPIPGKSIKGQTKGPDDSSIEEPMHL
jgi:hypothetical protein